MADCACLKGYFDYYIKWLSKDKIIFVDASDWMEGERYKGEKVYDLTMTNIITKKELSFEIKGKTGQVLEDKDASFSGGIYLFYVFNCDTPYYRYGVSFYDIQNILDELILNHYEDMKETIIDLDLAMRRLEIMVNKYTTKQNEEELISEYNALYEYVEQLKCKL